MEWKPRVLAQTYVDAPSREVLMDFLNHNRGWHWLSKRTMKIARRLAGRGLCQVNRAGMVRWVDSEGTAG